MKKHEKMRIGNYIRQDMIVFETHVSSKMVDLFDRDRYEGRRL